VLLRGIALQIGCQYEGISTLCTYIDSSPFFDRQRSDYLKKLRLKDDYITPLQKRIHNKPDLCQEKTWHTLWKPCECCQNCW